MQPFILRTSLVAQTVKNVSEAQETWVRSLGWKISWRREWQPTPVLAWRILQTEEPGGLQSRGLQRVGQDWATNTCFRTERNTNWNMIICFSFVWCSNLRGLIETVWKRMWQFLLECMTNRTSSRHIFYRYICTYALCITYGKNVLSLFVVAKDCKHPNCSLIEN